jgi:hypothetical protein
MHASANGATFADAVFVVVIIFYFVGVTLVALPVIPNSFFSNSVISVLSAELTKEMVPVLISTI